MTADALKMGFIWYVVFLFSTVLHEAFHAFTSFRLGDPTAYEGGQASLDPLPHIRREKFGMVIVPLLSFLFGGWMIGWASTPYDSTWAMRYPKRSALMSLAGPIANLALFGLSMAILRLGLSYGVFSAPQNITLSHVVDANGSTWTSAPATFLSILFSLNLILLLFNLLPLPPLDGSGIIPFVLSHRQATAYLKLIRNPIASLIGIMIAWRLFGSLFRPIHLGAVSLLHPGGMYH